MPAGRVVFWTLVGGGSVALTAFALKYYLKRKSSGSASVTPPSTLPVTPITVPEPGDAPAGTPADAPAEEKAVEKEPTEAPAEVVIAELPAETTNSAPEISEEVVVTPADEAATVDAAPTKTVDVIVNETSTRPTVIISSKANADGDDGATSSTPPTTSFAYLLDPSISVDGQTPPTPPSTPAPPSRGDEEGVVTPMYDPSLDLIQAAIQGRLAAVKPRFHSSDSTAEEREDEDAADDRAGGGCDIAPDVEGGGEGDATTAVDGGVTGAVVVAAAAAAAAGKLQPIDEEVGAKSAAVETSSAGAASDAPELPPKSPYVRRKKRSIQPELEEMKEHQLQLLSDPPSPATSPAASPPKGDGIAAASPGSSPPLRTPRLRRRSDRRSTGEIKISTEETTTITTTEAKSGEESGSSSNGSSAISGGGSGVTGGDESTSSIDFSFMSDAEEAMKDVGVVAASASAGAAPEVDLLEGIEDVTLDDVLRDISSMTESTAVMSASMVVEVDGASTSGRKDDVDEDLAKQLDLAEDLVLDDKFFGDLTPSLIPKRGVDGSAESVPDLIFNEPRDPKEEVKEGKPMEEEAYDMRVSIGFTDKAGFDEEDSKAASEAAAEDAAATENESLKAEEKVDAAETPVVVAEEALGEAAADAGAEAAAIDDAVKSKPAEKMTKPAPKRVVRPRKERPPLEGVGSAKSSKEETTPSKKSPTAASTKSPPSKTPRGTGKRSGIPRPGFQP